MLMRHGLCSAQFRVTSGQRTMHASRPEYSVESSPLSFSNGQTAAHHAAVVGPNDAAVVSSVSPDRGKTLACGYTLIGEHGVAWPLRTTS